MHALRLTAPVDIADRMTIAVFVAVMVHALVLLGVSFEAPPRPPDRAPDLDVVLVQPQAREQPAEDAELLAQRHVDGGGEHSEQTRPASPTPSTVDAAMPAEVASAPPAPALPPVEAQPRAEPQPRPAPAQAPLAVLDTRDARSSDVVTHAERPRPRARPRAAELARVVETRPAPAPPTAVREVPPPAPARLTAAALVSNGLAMASLSAELDRRQDTYSKRSRSKWISSSTREYRYAAYMEAWRAKVERVGNLNYPDEARRRRLSGKLQLEVVLHADGSVQRITVSRSSGHKVLDDAAVRIVKLAAPFAPFPDSFRDEIDQLHIERTWQFLNSNRLAAN